MYDVFISYARPDEDRAQTLAAAFEECDFRVWWDRKIAAGEHWSSAIANALTQSRCVVVLWSKSSINSDFVRDETQHAKDRGQAVIQVLIDDVEVPLGYRQLQTTSLVDWSGDTGAVPFTRLAEAIADSIGATFDLRSLTVEHPESFDDEDETGTDGGGRVRRWNPARQRLLRRIERIALSTLVVALLLLGVVLAMWSDQIIVPTNDRLQPTAWWETPPRSLVRSGTVVRSPAWTWDGNWIVYASNENGSFDLFMRHVENGMVVALTDTPDKDETQPAFAPKSDTYNGYRLAFVGAPIDNAQARDIYLTNIAMAPGPLPQRLDPDIRSADNPRWSPDGSAILFERDGNLHSRAVDGAGAEQHLFNAATADRSAHAIWSSDGEHILFSNRAAKHVDAKGIEHLLLSDANIITADGVHVGALELIDTGEELAGLALSPKGDYLVFAKGPFQGHKYLWGVGVDIPGASLTSRPVPISFGHRAQHVDIALNNFSVDASVDGVPVAESLAFVALESRTVLMRGQLDPARGALLTPPSNRTSMPFRELPLLHEFGMYPAVSPDGTKIAWTAVSQGAGQLYWQPLDAVTGENVGGKITAASDGAREVNAEFTEDGGIMFASTRSGSYQIEWKQGLEMGHISRPQTTAQKPVSDTSPSWARQNAALGERKFDYVFQSRARVAANPSTDIWAALRGQAPFPLVASETAHESQPSLSPDGRWLAYQYQVPGEGSTDIWVYDVVAETAQPVIAAAALDWPAHTEECRPAWLMTNTGLKLYFASNSGGAFNVWMLDYPNGKKPRQVTRFPYSPAGARMPDRCGYTKFALTADSLIVPVETRRSEILVLEQKVSAEAAGD